MKKITKNKLEEILENHGKWLSTNGEEGECANLRDVDLRRVDLRGAHLSLVDLSGADLVCANLYKADLSGAYLINANLRCASLGQACLVGAHLKGADLENASLDYAMLPMANGDLDVHIDDRQATQLLYRLARNVLYSKNTTAKIKRLFRLKPLIKKANEFHRVGDYGKLPRKGEGE